MDVDAYLNRIRYAGSREANAETLRKLQIAHLRSVPFENLSIHANEPIVLEDDALFAKIVERKRGGFCYEANGLFAALLRLLGFEVVKLSAGVAREDGGFSADFDHMALMVTTAGGRRWLVDVGFGDSALEPLLLDETRDQVQGTEAFRIVRDNGHLILFRRKEDQWKPQYRFTLDPYEYPDYAEMCHFHQTSPDSHFTKARLCSMATAEGRITLTGMRFITTSATQRMERTLTTTEEYEELLRDAFGIVM